MLTDLHCKDSRNDRAEVVRGSNSKEAKDYYHIKKMMITDLLRIKFFDGQKVVVYRPILVKVKILSELKR